ncbi:Uracil permease, partial [Bacillus sp. XF8]|nr:Uracil permease [Bacillus sp. XF8]
IRADFFELDFAPCPTPINKEFDKIREKVVLDLTLKVLQTQQVEVGSVSNPSC